MSVLQEIISEATSKSGDVARLLRLCQVLAARLKHEPLKTWVKSELEGYDGQELLPNYRILAVINRGHFIGMNFRGTLDIPVSLLPEEFRPRFINAELRGTISEYADLVLRAEGDGVLEIPWPVQLTVHYASKLVKHGKCINAWKAISPSEVVGMIDQIKTRVLGFVLEIESEAPEAGSAPSMLADVPPEKVHHSFVTNIYGNIGALQTGAGSTSHISKLPSFQITPSV